MGQGGLEGGEPACQPKGNDAAHKGGHIEEQGFHHAHHARPPGAAKHHIGDHQQEHR
mgnify:CR=1 FL=1